MAAVEEEVEAEEVEVIEETIDVTQILDQLDTIEKKTDDNAVDISDLQDESKKVGKMEKEIKLLHKKVEKLEGMIAAYETMVKKLHDQVEGDIIISRRRIEDLASHHLVDSFARVHSRKTKVIKVPSKD